MEIAHKRYLSALARDSIRYGLDYDAALPVNLDAAAAEVQQPGASFVTLTRDESLRGCIGTLTPRRSLAEDVAHNAYASAFHDPRFPALGPAELGAVRIGISVLSRPTPLVVASEDELVARLRPGVDGLILAQGGRRGTFLPAVWEQLPDAREFVRQLKRKAGFDPDYWCDTVEVERYVTESWAETDLD